MRKSREPETPRPHPDVNTHHEALGMTCPLSIPMPERTLSCLGRSCAAWRTWEGQWGYCGMAATLSNSSPLGFREVAKGLSDAGFVESIKRLAR